MTHSPWAGDMPVSQSSGNLSTPSDNESCDENALVDPEIMRGALSAIAQEVIRFHSKSTVSSSGSQENVDIFAKILHLRSTIKKKNKAIKLLKKNIKIASCIVKSVIAAKENETVMLNQHLKSARGEAAVLTMQTRLRDDILQKMTIESKILQQRVQHFHTFIERGYKELQKMKNEKYEYEELPVAAQLKNIIFSCGQYYADYRNEHAKSFQLERRNRFLMNKIHVLETNLQSVSGEVNYFHRHNECLRKEKSCPQTPKPADNLPIPSDTISRCTNPLTKSNDCLNKLASCCNTSSNSRVVSDLSSHLVLVKSLLDDQDKMLKDLRELSIEFNPSDQ